MEHSQHQSTFRSAMTESIIPANNMTMAGHPSDLYPTPTQVVVSTTSEIDVDQENGTKTTKELSPQHILQDELTPAAALQFELDFDFLDAHPDHIDWENYFPEVVGDNTENLSQGLLELNDKTPEGGFFERAFDASAIQPESRFWPGFPFDLDDDAPAEQPWDERLINLAPHSEKRFSTGFPIHFNDGTSAGESFVTMSSITQPESHSLPCFPSTQYLSLIPQTQFTGTQEPIPATQRTIGDDADLLAPAVEGLSDSFGVSGSPGPELNGSMPGNFEFSENSSQLGFLQNLQLIGGQPQLATSVNIRSNSQTLPLSMGINAIQGYEPRRVAWNGLPTSRGAIAGSSEPNPEHEHRAILTNPRRLSKAYRRKATRNQPSRSQIQQKRYYIENSAYTPLDQAPEKWDIFEYTKDGELDPSSLFSAEEINRFLFTHPLHQGHHDLKESQLRLRVHKTPSSSAKRFPNGLMCRFKDCPMRTINQGQLLIVVDELSVQHPDHDHFLNAAYFHLWCIERYCDFPRICAKLNVSAEGRNARKEEGRKNRFCLALGEEERVVEDFVEACCANARRGTAGSPWVAHCPDQQTNGCPHYDPQTPPYKGTLCHQLAITKLHYGGRGRINLRKDREDRAGYEGANITRHLGDLSKEAELRKYTRSHKNQNQLRSNPKTGRFYRADGDEIEEGERTGHGYYDMDTYMADTPGISPRTTLTPRSPKPQLQLQITTTNPPPDGRSAESDGLSSAISEDESEGDIELKILAAQRKKRALEIEDAKDNLKECKIRKLKLQKASREKRAREEGNGDRDENDLRGKRQRA